MAFQSKIFPKGTNRYSQVSKVTSTPQSVTPDFSASPNISSITNEEVPMEIDSSDTHSETNENISSSSGHQESFSSSDTGTNEKSRKKTKEITFQGFWSSLKPLKKNGLYFKIMVQPEETQSIVIDLLNIYKTEKENAISLIIQLFVDMCGFQNVSVRRRLRFPEEDFKEFFKKLEESVSVDSQKFIFMKITKFENSLDFVISKFINNLVKESLKSDALLDDLFTKYIFECISSMSSSSVRCIRVTGVIIVIKFLTAFVKLHNKFLKCLENNNDDSTDTIDNYKNTIENFIDFLYLIYNKNCLIADRRCYIIKIKCLQEMIRWIKIYPSVFLFRRKCFIHLTKLIVDHNEIVRQSALQTCEKLISTEEIKEEMSQRLEECLNCAYSRIVDVDYKVVLKTLSLFTTVLDLYPDFITDKYKTAILDRIFEKNIAVAKACGKFLAKYLRYKQNDATQVLLSFIEFAYQQKEREKRFPFLMSACMTDLPELDDYKLIINMLLDKTITYETRKRVINIFYESVKFSLTGTFSLSYQIDFQEPRRKFNNNNEYIKEMVISNFEDLMVEFQVDKACLKQIVEILTFMCHDEEHSEEFYFHYNSIFAILKDLFNVSNDPSFLQIIADAFLHFLETQQFHNIVTTIIDDIKNTHIKVLLDDLKDLSKDTNREVRLRLRETSVRISVLFEKFNLTASLKWVEIFQIWDNNTFKMVKYLMICCKWHLIWNLRKVISSSERNGEFIDYLLYNNCKDFVYGCLDMLRFPDNNSFLVYETLCDFYSLFEKELKRKRQFSNLFITIPEQNCQEILMKFVVKYVIENSKLPLQQRQKYLSNVVDVIYLQVIPVDNFQMILQHYHSHYAEFGTIMDDIIIQLQANIALPLVIMHTLTQVYTAILEKHSVVDIGTEDGRRLKQLIKKFASLKEIKSSLLKLTQMSINFAFRKQQNFTFLHYVRYFAKLLNEEGKADAYDLFRKMVPKEHKQNNDLLLFAHTLKQSH